MNIFRRLGLIMWASAFIMLNAPAFAQADKTSAAHFTQALVDELSDVANDASLSESARNSGYRTVLKDNLATQSIGKFLFKGAPTELANETQKSAYQTLFPDFIAAAFADEIGGLAERDIEIKRSLVRSETEAIVQSHLVDNAGRKKASIDWRLRWVDGEPRLLDVLVERVSPLVTKRQEFSSLAKRDGVDALLDYMKGVSQ